MTLPLLRVIEPAEAGAPRPRPVDGETLATAGAILADIDERGESGVIEHATRLGDLTVGARSFYPKEELEAAARCVSSELRSLLERTAARIRSFASAQRACLTDLDTAIEGGRAGHTCIPVRTAGCYAPGGRFPLPSSVLMTAVTARAAGVKEVWVASPRPTEATLAAAAIAGADGLLAVGGVQAIGALASGLCGVSPCDIIVGPGNRWVTAAKFLVSSRVGIDMLAGPSELLVLADETADPAIIAADLLAQAEHDDDAVPILVTTARTLPSLVDRELQARLGTLPTRATAERALRNGFAVVASDLDRAIALADHIAPEHLEVMTAAPREVASRLKNAGAVFIGASSAEVFGDYGAGPNHVLPTGATARNKSGLSVLSFLRARTWLEVDTASPGANALRLDAAALARVESLEAHARAAQAREQ